MSEKATKPSRRNTRTNDSNPCDVEIKNSVKCLLENNNNVEFCKKFVDNAKNCEKFWKAVKTDRKMRGIQPYMPPSEDRDQIRKIYTEKMSHIFK